MTGIVVQQNTRLWIGLILTAMVGYLIYSLGMILLPFITGLIGAYIFNRAVTWLERFRISRGIGSAIIVLGLIIILTTVSVVALPYLQQHLIILATSTPKLVERFFNLLTPYLEQASRDFGAPPASEIKAQLTSHIGDIASWSIRALTNLLSNGLALASLLSLVILTPLIMFYLLKDWPTMISTINRLLPENYAPQVRHYAYSIDSTLSSYAKGQAMVCLILMVVYAACLGYLGLDQGIFIGIMTGFLAFIPYIGMLIGFLASMGISFSQYTDWHSIGMIALVFPIVNLFEGYLLTPRLVGEKVGLHPVWIIFALLAGGSWLGFLGILIALPSAATVGVITRLALNWYLEKRQKSATKSTSPKLPKVSPKK